VPELWTLGGKRMHAVLTKRIEIPWKRLARGAAVFLSLPSWVFIIATVLFWSRVGKDDFVVQFLIIAGACWLSSSIAFLLFVRLRDDLADNKSGTFWSLCSGLPIVLIPLLVGMNIVYGLLRGLSEIPGMHDSM
jgi:hypothetical protein